MSVTPEFIGQKFTDSNTGNVWNSNSTTPGDWTLQVQDAKIIWEPKTELLTGKLPFVATILNAANGLPGITDVELPHVSIPYVYLLDPLDLQSLSAPLLTSITDGEPSLGYGIYMSNCQSLTSLLFPLLSSSENPIRIGAASLLISLSLPSLVTIPNSAGWESLNISLCAALTTISIPNFVPINTSQFLVSQTPLSASTVNHILAVHVANAGYVSGTIDLSGAAPTGQGIADKATLIGRGVSVTTT